MAESSKKKKKGNLENLEDYISDPPIETGEEEGGTPEEQAEKKALTDEIAALKKTMAEQEEKHLRILAEYDNFRKRSQKEREQSYSVIVSETIASFLPVVDNLERACDSPECDDGVRMIFKQLMEVLAKYNVKAYGEAGEEFDPNLHNAVIHEEDPDAEENIITEVMQKGYMMADRMIRPAMVKTVN